MSQSKKKKPFLSQNDLSAQHSQYLATLGPQIQRMVAFIEHEARERAEELDSKAEGEYCYEKGRLQQIARQDLLRLYEKKEVFVMKQAQIDVATMTNEARLRELAVREAHISSVEADIQERLQQRNQDRTLYSATLLQLIVQGLYRLLEKAVVVRVREEDVSLAEGLLGTAAQRFEDEVGLKVKLKVDKTSFLPPSSLGGVELATPNHKLRVTNTFHSRLHLIVRRLVPQIRSRLFDN